MLCCRRGAGGACEAGAGGMRFEDQVLWSYWWYDATSGTRRSPVPASWRRCMIDHRFLEHAGRVARLHELVAHGDVRRHGRGVGGGQIHDGHRRRRRRHRATAPPVKPEQPTPTPGLRLARRTDSRARAAHAGRPGVAGDWVARVGIGGFDDCQGLRPRNGLSQNLNRWFSLSNQLLTRYVGSGWRLCEPVEGQPTSPCGQRVAEDRAPVTPCRDRCDKRTVPLSHTGGSVE